MFSVFDGNGGAADSPDFEVGRWKLCTSRIYLDIPPNQYPDFSDLDEVISSFDVLKSQVLVITKRKEIELKQLSDINKCQSLMMEKKKEESMQIDIEHKKVYDKCS